MIAAIDNSRILRPWASNSNGRIYPYRRYIIQNRINKITNILEKIKSPK